MEKVMKLEYADTEYNLVIPDGYNALMAGTTLRETDLFGSHAQMAWLLTTRAGQTVGVIGTYIRKVVV